MIPSEVILSPTRVELGLRCLRKHILADVLGQQPNDHSAPALDFGDVMHRGIAQYWHGNRDIHGASEIIRAGVTWPLNTTHTLELAMHCLEVYAMTARLMPFGGDEWLVEAIEVRQNVPCEVGTLSFQIDRLLRNANTGALALVDLKTASRCDKRWEAQWLRSLQMKLYAACVKKTYGQDLQWLIIEGLEKTKVSLHYLTLPEVSEERQAEAMRAVEWVALHDDLLLSQAKNADGSINVQKLTDLALTQTPFSHAECFTYNSFCPYYQLCEAEPSERSALLAGEYHYEAPKHLV